MSWSIYVHTEKINKLYNFHENSPPLCRCQMNCMFSSFDRVGSTAYDWRVADHNRSAAVAICICFRLLLCNYWRSYGLNIELWAVNKMYLSISKERFGKIIYTQHSLLEQENAQIRLQKDKSRYAYVVATDLNTVYKLFTQRYWI